MFHQLLGRCLGLVNGPAWKGLRAGFGPAFTHACVASAFAHVDDQARAYVEDMPKQPNTTLGADQSLAAGVAEAVSAFPFFCTAEHLYGPLSPDEKAKLWYIGQMNLTLMGHVLAGGSTRFSFAPYLNRELGRKLKRFRWEWSRFNSHVYKTRRHTAPPPAFVTTWHAVEVGELQEEEVSAWLGSMGFSTPENGPN